MISAVDVKLALVHDHIANRHAERVEPTCPVCAALPALTICNACDGASGLPADPTSDGGYCAQCEDEAWR